VSHRAYIQVLAYHQPIGARTRTSVEPEIADLLVSRLAAERISKRVIRMMPPDSPFLPALKSALPEVRFVPSKLPPAEIENVRFIPPKTSQRPTMAAIRASWDWSHDQVPA
jgi:hypothetical protein